MYSTTPTDNVADGVQGDPYTVLQLTSQVGDSFDVAIDVNTTDAAGETLLLFEVIDVTTNTVLYNYVGPTPIGNSITTGMASLTGRWDQSICQQSRTITKSSSTRSGRELAMVRSPSSSSMVPLRRCRSRPPCSCWARVWWARDLRPEALGPQAELKHSRPSLRSTGRGASTPRPVYFWRRLERSRPARRGDQLPRVRRAGGGRPRGDAGAVGRIAGSAWRTSAPLSTPQRTAVVPVSDDADRLWSLWVGQQGGEGIVLKERPGALPPGRAVADMAEGEAPAHAPGASAGRLP